MARLALLLVLTGVAFLVLASPAAADFPGASVSARGTVLGTVGEVTFSAHNECDTSGQPRPFIIEWATDRFTRTSVSPTLCSNDPAVPTPGVGFDTQTGTARGQLRGGVGATATWKFVDGGLGGSPNDRVELSVRREDIGLTVVTVLSQAPGPLDGTPGGVWTFFAPADLVASIIDNPDPVVVGGTTTVTGTVTNAGPGTARNSFMEVKLDDPDHLRIDAVLVAGQATPTDCEYLVARIGVRCRIPISRPGDGSQIILEATGIAAGPTGSSVSATSGGGLGGPDPDMTNNSAHEGTTVVP